MSVVEMGHLGGYIEGGDDATFYPDLWEFLVTDMGVKKVLDVGCGEGKAIDYFHYLGAEAEGVDGVPQNHHHITEHDFTKGEYGPVKWYDLIWCCEFVEHVEERYVTNFLYTFRAADLILLTHAEPGQPGYHHVNCRSADYWRGAMASIGYREDEMLTGVTRTLARANPHPYNHYVRSGMAFVSMSTARI